MELHWQPKAPICLLLWSIIIFLSSHHCFKANIVKYKSTKRMYFSTGKVVLELPSWLVRDQITGFTCLPAFKPAILWLYSCGWIIGKIQFDRTCLQEFFTTSKLIMWFSILFVLQYPIWIAWCTKKFCQSFFVLWIPFSINNYICGHTCLIIKAAN